MTSTSNLVNYSLRQNKAIERAIAFDGLREMINVLGIVDPVYVGFGSVWFSDFLLAHRMLGVNEMISIEQDSTTYKRAKFNAPYSCVEVVEGTSFEVLPELLKRPALKGRPWILWLDYDEAIDEDKLAELAGLLEKLPDDSVLITTFNGREGRYGKRADRQELLDNLLGDAAPVVADLPRNDDIAFVEALATAVENYLMSKVLAAARKGSGVAAFRLPYKDTAAMATVGIYLPREGNTAAARILLEAADWIGRVQDTIATAPLTSREVAALLSKLPSQADLTRMDVQGLGFDLEDEQVSSFQEHYLRFPSFTQVAH
jgi:hypothetical protein